MHPPHARCRRAPGHVFSTLALGLLLALPAPALAAGDDEGFIGIEFAPWLQSFSGDAAVDGDATNGTDFDFQETLDVEEGSTSLTARAWIRLFSSNRIYIDYAQSSRTGTETIEQDLVFNGTTYSATETIESEMDFKLLRTQVQFSILNFQKLQAGIDVGFNLAQVDMLVSSSVAGKERLDESIPYPTLGVHLGITPFKGFRIFAEVGGMSATISDNEVSLVDARLEVEYYFNRFVGILGGFRAYGMDIGAEDLGDLENNYNGPYFGAGVRF